MNRNIKSTIVLFLLFAIHYFTFLPEISAGNYKDDMIWYAPYVSRGVEQCQGFDCINFLAFNPIKEGSIPSLNLFFILIQSVAGNSKLAFFNASFFTFYILIYFYSRYLRSYFRLSNTTILFSSILLLFNYPMFFLYYWPVAIQHQLGIIGSLILLLFVNKYPKSINKYDTKRVIFEIAFLSALFFLLGFLRIMIILALMMGYITIYTKHQNLKQFRFNILYWFIPSILLMYYSSYSISSGSEGHQVGTVLSRILPGVSAEFLHSQLILLFLFIVFFAAGNLIFYVIKIIEISFLRSKNKQDYPSYFLLITVAFFSLEFTVFTKNNLLLYYTGIISDFLFPTSQFDTFTYYLRWDLLDYPTGPTWIYFILFILMISVTIFNTYKNGLNSLHFSLFTLFITIYYTNFSGKMFFEYLRAGFPSRYSIYIILFIITQFLLYFDYLYRKIKHSSYHHIKKPIFVGSFSLLLLVWAGFSIQNSKQRAFFDRFKLSNFLSGIEISSESLLHDLKFYKADQQQSGEKLNVSLLSQSFYLDFLAGSQLKNSYSIDIYYLNSAKTNNFIPYDSQYSDVQVYDCCDYWCNESGNPLNQSISELIQSNKNGKFDLNQVNESLYPFSLFSSITEEKFFSNLNQINNWIDFVNSQSQGKITRGEYLEYTFIRKLIFNIKLRTEFLVIKCSGLPTSVEQQNCFIETQDTILRGIDFSLIPADHYFQYIYDLNTRSRYIKILEDISNSNKTNLNHNL